MPSMMPAIWVYSTDGRWNAAESTRWPGCFSKPQQARLERLRQAKMLFDGKHKEFFLDEDRSQFYFKPMRLSNGRIIRMYQKRNMLKLISLVSATLLLGQESLIRCQDEIQQAKIDAFKEAANLHSVLIGAAISCSYCAETFLEAQVVDGQVYLQQVPANEIFPIGSMLPNYQYRCYDRYQFFNAGEDDKPIWLALITHMLPGVITRECWQCEGSSSGGPDKLSKRLSLDQWVPNPALPDSQPTGIRSNTIIYIPNLIQDGAAVSDYDGVIDDQDKVNAKETQLARVIAQFLDPKLAADADMADDQGNADAAYDMYFRRRGQTKDHDPAYITFEADLAAARADRTEAVMALLIETETSPVLVGFEQGAAPETFDTVRLRSMTSLNKAGRKALLWKNGIALAVNTCLDLINTLPGERFDRSPIEVTLRDGIPTDPQTQATVQSTLKTAGLMSTEAAVEERYGGDREAAALELSRINAEKAVAAAQATPSILFNGDQVPAGKGGDVASGGAPGEPAGGDGDDDEGAGLGGSRGAPQGGYST